MARLAQTHQILVHICQLRVFVGMFDVMHHNSRPALPISRTPYALVSIPAFDFGRLGFPLRRVIIKFFHSGSPPRWRESGFNNRAGTAITSNLCKQKQPGFPDCLCEGVYKWNCNWSGGQESNLESRVAPARRIVAAEGTKGSPAAQGGNLRRYQQKLFPGTS